MNLFERRIFDNRQLEALEEKKINEIFRHDFFFTPNFQIKAASREFIVRLPITIWYYLPMYFWKAKNQLINPMVSLKNQNRNVNISQVSLVLKGFGFL